MSATFQWMLCRWMEGDTALRVYGDNHPAYDKTAGLVFCGPLSRVEMKELRDLGRHLGFPKIMKPERFKSDADAAEFAEMKGEHIAIDVPAPIDSLLFFVKKYSHYNGRSEMLAENVSFEEAEKEFALALHRHDPNAHYIVHTMDCVPDWDRIRDYRPTKTVADRILAKTRELRAAERLL